MSYGDGSSIEGITAGFLESANGPVDDGKSQGADEKTNTGIDDGLTGGFGFIRIARREHKSGATFDNKCDGDDAGDTDNRVEETMNRVGDVFAGVCSVKHVDSKVGDGEREADNEEANTGINDGLLGFLEFVGITRRGDVIITTNDDEDGGDETANGNNPIDGVLDEFGGGGTTLVDAISIKGSAGASEGDAN